MFRVMVKIYFKCQDGYDYMYHEYSGVKYNTKEEAIKELEEASKSYEAYIEECWGGKIICQENQEWLAEELLKIDICRKGLVNRKSYSNKVAEK